ncbi:MAG TPA: TonB-dependent receptor [Bryobacteraceae bacterium]|nr:TonB-dependent receptor [Bryobacteraceae bacterium]
MKLMRSAPARSVAAGLTSRPGRCLGFALLCSLLIATWSPGTSYAQAVYGSIFGTVTDPTGGVVPNARITIIDMDKNIKFETTTNAAGNYSRSQLVPGRYQVEVEAAGFRKAVSRDILVGVDAAARVDVKLEVGAVSEQVEVTAEAPLLKSDRADVATTFSANTLVELPNQDRNFQSYLLLVPGSQKLGWQHASSENPQGSAQIMVGGQHFSGTGYLLDGTDNQDPILGIIVINPVMDSIAEAKVITQNYDAEFGLATSGMVAVQTKSGTNEFHGSAFEFFRNNSPGFQVFAKNPFNPAEREEVPPVKWNQFGGTLGGPIKKDRLFFFGDYQGTRRRTGSSVLTQVPTLKARQGDFSEYLEPLPGAPLVRTTSGRLVPLQRNMIFDPLTGDPVTGEGRLVFETDGVVNKIPQSRLSPQALNLIRLLPNPNATDPGGSPFRRNFAASGSEKFDSDQFDTRIDWYVSEKASLFGRYSFADFRKRAPGAFGDLLGGPALDNIFFGGQSEVRNQSLAVGYNHTISPTLLTEIRFGYMRYRVNVLPNGVGTTPAADAGIPNLNSVPGVNQEPIFTSGMPAFFVNGDGGFNFGYALGVNQCNCPLRQSEQQFQWVSNTTKISGNHSIKFGADLRYALQLRVPSDAHRAGELSFDPGYTGLVRGAETLQGLGLATFMLGHVTAFRRFVSPFTDAAERQKRFFWYGQDTWRITPKLTLNYGLRWEQVFPEKVNGRGKGGQLDLRTGEIAVFGVGGVSDHGIQDMKWTNFAPRLGVAYQITPKTVVRAGYGWSYALGTFGSIFGHNVTQNLPVLAIQDLRAPSDFTSVFTLAQGPPTPVFPEPGPNGRFPLPVGVSGKARPLNVRMPRSMAYNATIQRQITPTLSVEAAFVGNVGRHVFTGDGPAFNVNEAAFVPGVADANVRKPFFGFLKPFGWTQAIDFYCNCATSEYDSLQIKVDKRFSRGFQISGWYTLSRSIQDAGSFEFLYRRDLGRGVADWDRKHMFNINELWELPFGRGRRFGNQWSKGLDLLLGGWRLSGITLIYGGLPFTPFFDNPDPSRFIRPNAGPGNRPDRGPGSPYPANRSRDQWIVRGLGDAFLIPANNEFGNFGRNTLRGPRFFNQDLALHKDFSIGETYKLTVRFETYNTFNTTNLGQPNANVTSADAGRISSLAPGGLGVMRRIQFAARLAF